MQEGNPFQTPPFKASTNRESVSSGPKEFKEQKLSDMGSLDPVIKASSISISFTPYAKNNASIIKTIDKLEKKESLLSSQIFEKDQQLHSLKSEESKVKGLAKSSSA